MNTTTAPHSALATLQKLASQIDALATRSSRAATAGVALAGVGADGRVRGIIHPRLPRPSRPGWVQQWRSHDYRRRLARWERTSGLSFGGHA